MKLLTLNTHSIVEPNYEHKLEIFVREISRIRPDIIALQEVNQTNSAPIVSTHTHSNFAAQIKSDNHAYRVVQMLKDMGIRYYWCWLPIKLGYEKYDEGLAVLSRYPITDAQEILLSRSDDYNNWRTRKALVVQTENRNLGSICNVHMGWWDDEQDSFAGQWEKLVAGLPKGAVWLMGDFNSPDTKANQGYDMVKKSGFADVYRCVSDAGGITVPGSIDGWHSCAPRRIDYIWSNRTPVVHSCSVCFNKKQVSDHYGVLAEVDFANHFERSSGILMPIFSLPSDYGIGCFDECAYRFVDFLAESGQRWWQILPLGTTGYGDSPYQSFSSFGGNPYFISIKKLVENGLLDKSACPGKNTKDKVDYGELYCTRYKLLRSAFAGWMPDDGYSIFCRDNATWLDDYSLFMAVKDLFGGAPWYEWDDGIKMRHKGVLEHYTIELAGDIEFYKFVQYMFHKQWHKLKAYANKKGIEIIGDIPIYVAYDSADCWAHPELFQLDSKLCPVSVAGCPPDGFSPTGQLWGNPLYNWQIHSDTGFAWWIQRMHYAGLMYDVVRLDHFRGFDEYYAIPYGSPDATCGRWEPGPGMALFDTLRMSDIRCKYIAEDLGFVTDGVKSLLEGCGFPGMKIVQFAFDSRDSSSNDHIPYNYTKNSVVYTGTHDNHTLAGWYENISEQEREYVRCYLGVSSDEDVADALIRCAMASVSDVCIIPLADWLHLGDNARINTPSTFGGNWSWRLDDMACLQSIKDRIKSFTDIYGR